MKPFLLLATRPEDAAADGEAAALRRLGGLEAEDLHRVRLEQAPLPELDLTDHAGVILGGGPFNSSDADKSELQQRIEADLARVLDQVFADRVPFLGLCYGIGTVTSHLGGLVDRGFGEPVGAVTVSVTAEGRKDPLLAEVGEEFRAFVGHKEAVARLPEGAVLLATGQSCPVQMYRIGTHCWVTQFHPELDAAGIKERIHVYRDAGYFEPEQVDQLCAEADRAGVTPVVHSIVRRFVDLHR
ncbi:MAG: glutamine amidotransferase [Arachnia propionica]|uniref:glutamine amidotransferase n=1 Tax=Arachnia propionica TaxID=1750 RepID=UPI0026FCA7DF|nr:glutamine amidotransferase [Arachnia propionica]